MSNAFSSSRALKFFGMRPALINKIAAEAVIKRLAVATLNKVQENIDSATAKYPGVSKTTKDIHRAFGIGGSLLNRTGRLRNAFGIEFGSARATAFVGIVDETPHSGRLGPFRSRKPMRMSAVAKMMNDGGAVFVSDAGKIARVRNFLDFVADRAGKTLPRRSSRDSLRPIAYVLPARPYFTDAVQHVIDNELPEIMAIFGPAAVIGTLTSG